MIEGDTDQETKLYRMLHPLYHLLGGLMYVELKQLIDKLGKDVGPFIIHQGTTAAEAKYLMAQALGGALGTITKDLANQLPEGTAKVLNWSSLMKRP